MKLVVIVFFTAFFNHNEKWKTAEMYNRGLFK